MKASAVHKKIRREEIEDNEILDIQLNPLAIEANDIFTRDYNILKEAYLKCCEEALSRQGFPVEEIFKLNNGKFSEKTLTFIPMIARAVFGENIVEWGKHSIEKGTFIEKDFKDKYEHDTNR